MVGECGWGGGKTSCATHLLSCLEQVCLYVISDILSGSINNTCRRTHMQVEDLEMVARLRVFRLPNFKTWGELAPGFWWHINPHVACKKLMLHFLARDHFHIYDKSAHDSTEMDDVYLHDCVSRLVCDDMAVTFLETCVPKKQVKC